MATPQRQLHNEQREAVKFAPAWLPIRSASVDLVHGRDVNCEVLGSTAAALIFAAQSC